MGTLECDLLIVGGGPAGFSAAINGASEGLSVVVIDSGPEAGGQARNSSLIENYPGFKEGISGETLMSNILAQAAKFKTDIRCPDKAIGLHKDGVRRVITTEDEDLLCAKVVILAAGLSYRRLIADGIGRLMGRGVLYGAPTFDPKTMGDCDIAIVGGANSAGQAAMHMSKNPAARVKLLVRKDVRAQMSTYLVERIQACPNIEVVEGVEVTRVDGELKLEELTLKNLKDESTSTMKANHLFIFIGASPKTQWLNGTVASDDKKFILTGPRLIEPGHWKEERQPFGFETSVPGVFACGDVRLGSTKRIASAVGEGSVAVQTCHDYLALIGHR